MFIYHFHDTVFFSFSIPFLVPDTDFATLMVEAYWADLFIYGRFPKTGLLILRSH